MQRSSIAFVILLLSASCSKLVEMDKRTKKMEKSTSELEKTTGIMYQQIRSGDAMEKRNQSFDLLMRESSGIRTKVTAACMYMKSFEFQLWTDNQTYDSQNLKNVMYLDAVNEFTRRTGDLYDLINPKKLSPVNSGPKYNNDFAFYALSVSLHLNHHFQDELVRIKSNLQTNSMFDIMKSALRKDSQDQQMEAYEEVLVAGQTKEVMIELMKARVDILSAFALKNLTESRDMDIGQKSKALIHKVTNGSLGDMDFPEIYDKSNNATKNQTQDYLEGALKTKEFLKEIGVTKSLDKTLKSAFKNIDFNEQSSSQQKIAIDEKKDSIKKLINKLVD